MDHTAATTDPALDFTFLPVQRPAATPADGLRQSALLLESAPVSCRSGLAWLAEEVQTRVGEFGSVWSIKFAVGLPSWEVYFYVNHGKLANEGLEYLTQIGSELFGCSSSLLEKVTGLRPDVISIDIDQGVLNQRPVDAVNLYVGNPLSRVPSGLSYRVSEQSIQLANLYHKCNSTSRQCIRAALHGTLHLGSDERWLDTELLPCDSIHVARKPDRDGLYYGGINMSQTRYFLSSYTQESPLSDFLADSSSRLVHHKFDVGLDYQRFGNRVRVVKAAVYVLL